MTQHIPLSQQQAHEPHTKSFIEDGIEWRGTVSTLTGAAAGKPSLFDRNSRKATARTASPPCTDHPLEDCLGRTMEKKEKKGLYALALALGFAVLAYFLLKRSTRPSASTIFWVPVKNGWQLEQMSTFKSPTVVRV